METLNKAKAFIDSQKNSFTEKQFSHPGTRVTKSAVGNA